MKYHDIVALILKSFSISLYALLFELITYLDLNATGETNYLIHGRKIQTLKRGCYHPDPPSCNHRKVDSTDGRCATSDDDDRIENRHKN